MSSTVSKSNEITTNAKITQPQTYSEVINDNDIPVTVCWIFVYHQFVTDDSSVRLLLLLQQYDIRFGIFHLVRDRVVHRKHFEVEAGRSELDWKNGTDNSGNIIKRF